MKMDKIELQEVTVMLPGAQYPSAAMLTIESDGEIGLSFRHPQGATMIWQLVKEDRFQGLEINIVTRAVEAQEGRTDAQTEDQRPE